MAQLTIKELFEAIKARPKYSDWEMEVPAEQALYVQFGAAPAEGVESDVLTTSNGSELVLDKNADGIVVGIEII